MPGANWCEGRTLSSLVRCIGTSDDSVPVRKSQRPPLWQWNKSRATHKKRSGGAMTEDQISTPRKSDLRRRRILLVSHETTLSGAPIQLVHLAGWLNARGWKIAIVAPEDGPVLNRARLPGVELVFESQLLIDPAYAALRRLTREF